MGARASRLREVHSDDDSKQSLTALQEGHTKSSDYIPLPMSTSKPQSYSTLPVVRGGEHPAQGEAIGEPDAMTDNFTGKAVVLVPLGVGRRGHVWLPILGCH